MNIAEIIKKECERNICCGDCLFRCEGLAEPLEEDLETIKIWVENEVIYLKVEEE